MEAAGCAAKELGNVAAVVGGGAGVAVEAGTANNDVPLLMLEKKAVDADGVATAGLTAEAIAVGPEQKRRMIKKLERETTDFEINRRRSMTRSFFENST